MTTGKLTVDVDVRTSLPAEITEDFVLRVLTAAALRVEQSGYVSVSFVDDEEIHRLNLDYRGVDRPTDVLSFAFLEGESSPAVDDGPERILGDVVISVPTAICQAQEYRHSVSREIGFLLVHGLLHLVGYDHQDESAEREMFGLQDEVLHDLNLSRDPGIDRP